MQALAQAVTAVAKAVHDDWARTEPATASNDQTAKNFMTAY